MLGAASRFLLDGSVRQRSLHWLGVDLALTEVPEATLPVSMPRDDGSTGDGEAPGLAALFGARDGEGADGAAGLIGAGG